MGMRNSLAPKRTSPRALMECKLLLNMPTLLMLKHKRPSKSITDLRDAQAKLENEQRAKEVTRDGLLAAERKANSTQNALEEARTLLEQSDRARRVTEQELSDTNEQLSELTCQNQAIAGAKRKLESEMQTLHGDLDEMVGEAKISEGKATKAAVDAAH